MIKCALEQLPVSQNERLRAWLGLAEVKILVDVVSSFEKRYLTDALNDAVVSSGANLKMDGANANLMQAQRYGHFLEVLTELVERRDPFETAKLS